MIYDLKDILDFKENQKMNIIESLAGNNPICGLLFSSEFKNLDYRALDLADHSSLYFQKAQNLFNKIGISYNDFKSKVIYESGFNILDDDFEKFHLDKLDLIVHWNTGLKHFIPLSKDKEKDYLQIRKEEADKVKKGIGDITKRHLIVRNRIKNELELQKKGKYWTNEYDLEKYFIKCISSLNENGKIITNFIHDFTRIQGLMKNLGLKGENFEIDFDKIHLGNGGFVTVWRKN